MNKKYIPAFSYDFLTPCYDTLVELIGYGKAEREMVINLLDLRKGETLLDIGCGTGTLLILAKKKYPNVAMTGIDIDEKVLGIARKKSQSEKVTIDYIETSSAQLPFTNASFDVIVSSLVFHHLPTEVKKQTLKEIYRVLKSEGRFLLADFGKKEGFILTIIDFLTKVFQVPEYTTLQDNLKGKLPEYMKEVGFTIEEIGKRYRGIQFLRAKKI